MLSHAPHHFESQKCQHTATTPSMLHGLQGCRPDAEKYRTLRIQVPHNKVLTIWVIAIVVQVLGKYMIIGYLDP